MLQQEIISSTLIEGTDDVGKQTTTINLCKAILTADEIRVNGWKLSEKNPFEVIFTNYPQYFMPSGRLIRAMNSILPGDVVTGIDKFIQEKCNGDLDFLDELALRESIYALDRVMSLIVIDNWMNIWHHERPILHLSDRGYLSQVNTVSGVVLKHNKKDWFRSCISTVDAYDAGFIRFLNNPTSVILHKGELAPRQMGREVLDSLEIPESQELAIKGYLELLKEEKFKVKLVDAYDGQRRVGKVDMAMNVAKVAGLDLRGVPDDFVEFDFTNIINTGDRFSFISPFSFITSLMQPRDTNLRFMDLKSEFMEEAEWAKLYFSDESYAQAMYGKKKKEALNHLESKLAFQVAFALDRLNLDFAKARAINGHLVQSVQRLFNENPRLMELIKFLETETGLPPGFSNLLAKLFYAM